MDELPQPTDTNTTSTACPAAGAARLSAGDVLAKQSRVRELNVQIDKLRTTKAVIERELDEHFSPFKAGDKIKWRVGYHPRYQTRRGIVTRVLEGVTSNLSGRWEVRVLLKGGGTGARRFISYWEKPEIDDGIDFPKENSRKNLTTASTGVY